MFESWRDAIVDRVLDRLMPVIEREIDELSEKALALLQAEIPKVREQVLAMLPLIVATAAKSVVDQVIARMPDVDIPVISDVYDLTEEIRNNVNESTPENVHIPILSDILDRFGPLIGPR